MLSNILTSKFSVEDAGIKGPRDAPFNEGRLYTYMEFRASTVDDRNQKFLIRIHFKRKSRAELTFNRLEFLPLEDAPRNQESEQGGADQPANATESKLEGIEKPEPETKMRPQQRVDFDVLRKE